MPTTLALTLAHRIKLSPEPASQDGDFQHANDWFRRPGGRRTNEVRYADIAHHADKEYNNWRHVGDERIKHVHTLEDQLAAWVRATDVEEIARVLDTVPPGLGADPETGCGFDFTAWQRLSMAHTMRHLFSVTARVEVNTDDLRAIAGILPTHSGRRQPITAQMSMLAGSCPDKIICDLPTACGKTAWSLGVAVGLLLDIDRLVTTHMHKSVGVCVRGPPVVQVARLVIVATAGMTHDHFVTTARRIAPRTEAMDPTINVVVWDKCGKAVSTTRALAMPRDTLVIWIVPIEKVNAVLREDPCVTVPVVITDEYTVNTPREKSATDQSYVMHNVITQATPQALQDATRGNRSWLKTEFGGFLYGPSWLTGFIEHRQWADAKLAADQTVKLDLMTLTPFRTRIRDELRALIPAGLEVTFVRSRRVTFASMLLGTTAELVPANFDNVLLSQLTNFAPDTASIARLREALAEDVTTIAALVDILGTLTSDRSTDRAPVDRLCARLGEFDEGCPICMCEDTVGKNIYACCGYCVCDACYSRSATRCPFCRTAVRRAIPRAELPSGAGPDGLPAPDESYPSAPVQPMELGSREMGRNSTLANLTYAIHHLRANGHRRLLIVIERTRFSRELGAGLDVGQLSAVTDVDILRVDHILGGKASAFTAIKRQFDSPNPRAMALLSYGVNDNLMVGTDLAAADGIVMVGAIPNRILTQAVARTMRPNANRDNTRPLRQVNVYVA